MRNVTCRSKPPKRGSWDEKVSSLLEGIMTTESFYTPPSKTTEHFWLVEWCGMRHFPRLTCFCQPVPLRVLQIIVNRTWSHSMHRLLLLQGNENPEVLVAQLGWLSFLVGWFRNAKHLPGFCGFCTPRTTTNHSLWGSSWKIVWQIFGRQKVPSTAQSRVIALQVSL